MQLQNGDTYTITNSSIYITVLSVVEQNQDNAKVLVAYISKQGTPIGMERLELDKKNLKHWIKVPHVPFI